MKIRLLLLLGAFAATDAAAQTPAPSRPSDRPADVLHEKNLYTVGYAHLDTQWRWTYPLVIREYVANTMRQNFPLIEKYPDYIFNFSGSRRYEFMKEYYPEDFARVKGYVAAGRWFPCGSSVDEGDAIVPSFESYQRHFLYGNRFFDREFGRHSEEFMLPDCFGFPAGLPTILHHGGLKGFSTQKLTWRSAAGIPFNVGTWEGPDGSEIIAALNPLNYTGRVRDDLSQSTTWLNRINATGEKSGAFVDYHYYGTGDRGGAPEENSVRWIGASVAGTGPVRVISSRADQMFKDIPPEQAARLPRYKGELLLIEHSAGSITSQAYMKRWNRKNELLANAAESSAVAASWLGAFPYPHEALYQAWDLVLGSQMHDIMPGTSMPKAYEYSWNDEVLAANQFAAIAERASGAVLAALDTRAEGTPVAVYNPLSIEREDPVEILLPFSGDTPPAGVSAFDRAGNAVATQILSREGNALRLLFLAKVPSVGYAIYDLRSVSAAVAQPTNLSVTEKTLENARYRVTLDAEGNVASVFDKTAKRELLASPARLAFQSERPQEWPAWNMDWADRQKPPRGYVGGPAKVRVVESGPVRVALEIERTTEGSTFTEQIRLAAGSAGDRVENRLRMDWRSLGACLKADYRFTVANPEASYDAQAGVVRRGSNNSTHFEVPLHQWMDLTAASGDYGVAVLCDSKYGSDKPADNSLRLTLVYTPGVRDNYRDQSTQDLGRHEVLSALVGHAGDWAAGDVPWQAARLNQPLRAFLPDAHPGPLGRTFSLVALNSPQARIVAVKQAEDSDEVIVRVQETRGQPAAGLKLTFPAAVVSAREVNGQEKGLDTKLSPEAGALAFDLKAFGVRAFAVKLAAPPARVPAVRSQPVALAYDLDVVSPDSARSDGALDAESRTYPAELFPAALEREGVRFQLGAVTPGAKNALVARGQEIALPANGNRVCLLAAARNADFRGELKVGQKPVPVAVPRWHGFIGQWDNRQWDHPMEEQDDNRLMTMIGLAPGYVKPTAVAWFATHHHLPTGNTFYDFAYLFQVEAALSPDARTLTLPNDENLLIFAVSVVDGPGTAPAAAPLADTLADHRPGGLPEIPQAGRSFDDSTAIRLAPPLYYAPGDLRFTTDGSDPTASSAVYTKPFFLARTATVKVRQVFPDRTLGPVASGVINVHDITPPRLLGINAGQRPDELVAEFSEPVDPVASGRADAYIITPGVTVRAAQVAADGYKVTLTLDAPLLPDTKYVLETRGATDLAGNKLPESRLEISPFGTVFSRHAAKLPDERLAAKVENLPLRARDPWTLNLLVKPDLAPEDLTLIAGFGRPTNNPAGGTSRYLAKFGDGIRFWAAGRDVVTHSPLEVGRWQMLTVTYDGRTLTIYKDAEPIGRKDIELTDDGDNTVGLGLPDAWGGHRQFEGRVQAFTVRRGALTREQVRQLAGETKPF